MQFVARASDRVKKSRLFVDTEPCFLQIGVSSIFGDEALAQSVEHIPFKDGVDGSSPSRLTIFSKRSILLRSHRLVA